MSSHIETLIAKEDWTRARKVIKASLRRDPSSHWLLTRLGLTYYEEFDYKRALKYHEEALRQEPECPLAKWDHAGALDMLGRLDEAISEYSELLDRGIDEIAHGDCGEGVAWASRLFADCHYRLASCHFKKGQIDRAKSSIASLRESLSKGAGTIYSHEEIDKLATKIECETA